MAEVDDVPQLSLPEVQPAVRENGDAVVELRQDGQLVGEINFTMILTNWAVRLGLIKKPRPTLKSVP